MIMLNNNLHIFIKVADKKSITLAANELYISQPAVSKAIKNLEKELNVKLFHRDKRNGLILTNAGEKIRLLARQMSDMENRIYQTAFRENNFLGGKLKIGTIPIITTVVLPKVLAAYKNKYPYVTVEFVDGGASDVRKMVEEHYVDFGITYSPFGDLEHEILMRDKAVAVSKKPLTASTVNLLDEHTDLIFSDRSKETTLANLSGPSKTDFNKCMLVQTPESVIGMAEYENGIGIISDLVLSSVPNSLHVYPVEPAIELEIGLIANSFDDLTPVAAEFIRMLKEYIC